MIEKADISFALLLFIVIIGIALLPFVMLNTEDSMDVLPYNTNLLVGRWIQDPIYTDSTMPVWIFNADRTGYLISYDRIQCFTWRIDLWTKEIRLSRGYDEWEFLNFEYHEDIIRIYANYYGPFFIKEKELNK